MIGSPARRRPRATLVRAGRACPIR